jgi:hypothetical protein
MLIQLFMLLRVLCIYKKKAHEKGIRLCLFLFLSFLGLKTNEKSLISSSIFPPFFLHFGFHTEFDGRRNKLTGRKAAGWKLLKVQIHTGPMLSVFFFCIRDSEKLSGREGHQNFAKSRLGIKKLKKSKRRFLFSPKFRLIFDLQRHFLFSSSPLKL